MLGLSPPLLVLCRWFEVGVRKGAVSKRVSSPHYRVLLMRRGANSNSVLYCHLLAYLGSVGHAVAALHPWLTPTPSCCGCPMKEACGLKRRQLFEN